MTTKVARDCTIIFSGDIKSINEIFTSLKEKLIKYSKKSDGGERQNYKITEDTSRKLTVGGIVSIYLTRQTGGTVVLAYNCSIDISGWDYENFGRLLCTLHDYCKSIAGINGYTNVTQCVDGLPYSIVYTKAYIGEH